MKEERIIYRIINGKGENRRLDPRYVILGLFIFMVVASFSFMLTRNTHDANAADLSQFRAGNIMSDAVMRNYDSMTEGEIQNFLKSKNSCDDHNLRKASNPVNYFSENSPYSWHVQDGHFICMADEVFNGETAAHIIYEAARDYKINPQVLIVLLQKEQGLITDTFPHSIQYRSATGYGCPDTAACDSKYYGLRNQVRNAASLFNTVLSGGWTNYPVGNNYIRYNPNAACGGSEVYIENLATSALYRYTPYQPNQGALDAYTGTAGCGAYGNRNFFIYFSDWFGSTQVVQSKITQRYQKENWDKTGNMRGETVCKNSDGAIVDATQIGTYSCSQEYDKGTLYWTKVVDDNYNRTEKDEYWLSTATAEFYTSIPKDKIEQLGVIAGEVMTVKDSDGITYQALKFANGYILKNGDNVKTVTDKISVTWLDRKDIVGDAKSAISQYDGDTNLRILNCEHGVVLGNDNTGYHAIKQPAFDKWKEHKSELGNPTGSWQNNSWTGIEWQDFEKGVIVGNDNRGWRLSMGKSREVWQQHGFENGVLGWPVSDFNENTSTGIKWQDYTGGVIVGNDEKGWFISIGRSRDTWARNGFEGGILGYPTSNLERNSWNGMEWQYYENGAVVGNDSRGWFVSVGKSREVWARHGYENGALGWPTSDLQRNPWTGMEWQNYTGGVIVGNDERGWYESRSSIRDTWARNGFESGRYGWPTSDINGSCQSYTGGTICF